jgi:hypothetical protein
MPQYKFAWTNMSSELLKALVRDRQLPGLDPAEALLTEYGERPGKASSWMPGIRFESAG